jgi:Ras and EF-hand domain-containing protein
MLVGNKADLRDTAAAEGQKCVPGYFGEKLAMVSMRIGWNWKKT